MTDRPIDFDRDPGRVQIVLTNRVTEVSGNVTDEGRPAAHVPVVVFPADSRLWDFQSRHVRKATADENGHFTIRTLPAGEYHTIALSGMKSGTSWQRPSFLEPLLRDSARLTLHEAEHATVELRLIRR